MAGTTPTITLSGNGTTGAPQSFPSISGGGLLSGESLSSIPNAPGYVTPPPNVSLPGVPGITFSGIPAPEIPGTETPDNPLSQTSGTARQTIADNISEHQQNMQTYQNGQQQQQNSQMAQIESQLNGISNIGGPGYSDAFTQQLNALGTKMGVASQALINSINAQRQQAINVENTQATAYQSGLAAEGARTGSDISTPQLFQGQLAGAEAAQQAKLQTINSEYDKALATADQAYYNEDYKTLAEQNSYINELKTQALDTLKETMSIYQYNNLSPYQSASLGIEQQNANTNLSSLNLRQYIANNPAGTQTSASFLTPFKGQTTTKNVVQSVNVNGTYYPSTINYNGTQYNVGTDGSLTPIQ